MTNPGRRWGRSRTGEPGPGRGVLPSFLALALLAALPGPGSAQQRLQSVQGVVRDSAGTPLGGAAVLLDQRQTTTDGRGRFLVDSVPPGPHFISIRLPGYAPLRSRVVVLASGPTEVAYSLAPAALHLPAVVVEGRRTGVYGTVGDTSHRAVAGARVQVVGFRGGDALTDSSGRFAFPGADRGVYLVRVSLAGHAERRVMLELKRGEGRELAVRLTPARGPAAATRDEGVFEALGKRLAFGLARERLTPGDLSRYGRTGLCEIPRIRSEIGSGRGDTTTLILNGETVIGGFSVGSLCAWHADEVELVEFGTDICRDATHTLEALLNKWCSGRTRNVPRSIRGTGERVATQRAGGRYVVVWEKR